MAHVTLTLEEYEALKDMAMGGSILPEPGIGNDPGVKPRKKRKKVSKYSKEFGIQLKKLKKKHPRTKMSQLMAKAHVKTRKAMK
jgi:hypothetical protein